MQRKIYGLVSYHYSIEGWDSDVRVVSKDKNKLMKWHKENGRFNLLTGSDSESAVTNFEDHEIIQEVCYLH